MAEWPLRAKVVTSEVPGEAVINYAEEFESFVLVGSEEELDSLGLKNGEYVTIDKSEDVVRPSGDD